MELSYTYIKKGREFKNFVFKTEITVKNERLGWSLWAVDEYTDNNDGISHLVKYFLIFLENDSDGWKIKGGYHWDDGKIPRSDPYVYLSSPDNVWLDATKENPLPKYAFEEKYAGLWEVSDDGEGEIFSGIQLRSQKGELTEILGKADSVFSKSSDKSYGYEKLATKYSGDKWVTYYGKENTDPYLPYDATETINKWYQPFKGKKGKWRSFDKYCKEESSIKAKNLEENDPRIKAVLEWCYEKKRS